MRPVWQRVGRASSADAGRDGGVSGTRLKAPPQKRAAGADTSDAGGAQHFPGSVLPDPMLPSHILTDQRIASPPGGGGLLSQRHVYCLCLLTKLKYLNPGIEKSKQTAPGPGHEPCHLVGKQQGTQQGLAPRHLGRSPACLQRPSWTSSLLSTALTRHHSSIFFGGPCVCAAGLAVYVMRHTRTGELQGRWENQQDGKGRSLLGLCPPAPSRLDSRNQGNKRKDWSPKALANSHTRRTQQREKGKRIQWRGEKKKKKFIVTSFTKLLVYCEA